MAARREQILDGARTCFRRFGYEGATVRRLELATRLSRGAIFHHFRDKEELFLSVAREDARRMAEAVTEQGILEVMRAELACTTAGDPDISWSGIRPEMARRLRTDPTLRAEWEPLRRELTEAIRHRLERLREAGAIRSDVSLEVLTEYLTLSCDGLVSHLAQGASTEDLEAVLDLVEDTVRSRDSVGW